MPFAKLAAVMPSAKRVGPLLPVMPSAKRVGHLFICLCISFGVMSFQARAEELLGEEGEAESQEAPAPKKKKAPAKKKKAPAPAPEDDYEDSGSDISDDISLSGGFQAGGSIVGAHVTVGYSLHKFVGLAGTYTYQRYSKGDYYGEYYGPEVDLILRYPNKTIVTPFIGAGPGYDKWVREFKGESFDEGSSMTFNQFGGINIAFSRHFGLQVVRKQVTYLNDPPRRFTDPTVREERSTVSTNVGFYAVF